MSRKQYNFRETYSTEREMKTHSLTKDDSINKEVKGSAADNLKCLHLSMCYFVQPNNFTRQIHEILNMPYLNIKKSV